MFQPHRVLSVCLFITLAVATSLDGATSQKQAPVQQMLSSEVRDACDQAYAVAAKTPGVAVRQRTGTFRDELIREPVYGCVLTLSGSFARAEVTGDAAVRLRENFSAQGWQEMPAYSADGRDGTSFAFQKVKVACLVRGTWNGGAAGEPEIPAHDRYEVAVVCTSPVFPDKR